MRLLILGMLFCLFLSGCASKEVQLAELQLEAAKMQQQERKELRDAELIKEINAPKELLVMKGCGTSCEATLYNPFHKVKLPTNEWDFKINRDNKIASTLTSITPMIATANMVGAGFKAVEKVAVAATQNAGHNTTITEDNDTEITEQSESISSTVIDESSQSTVTTTEQTEITVSDSFNTKQDSENDTSEVITETITEIKEEEKVDEPEVEEGT